MNIANIELPRQDEDGNYYISYSQYTTWKDQKSFNLQTIGKQEYFLGYFFGHRFPDMGWGQFGTEVEGYICEREYADSFLPHEKRILEEIKPLGVFQQEIKIWLFANVYIKGFIDDMLPGFTHLRDYKTASDKSRLKYYKDDYVQLDIYAMFGLQETGKLPEKLEVFIVERLGNCHGEVERRDLLSVGTGQWVHERTTSIDRINKIRAELIAACYEISDAFKLFKKINR